MKLRWKHFLVLVAVSLVPLLTVAWISQNASRRLGKSISSKAQNTLTEKVTQEMVRTTRSYAMVSLMGGQTVEFALRLIAAEAELALALPPPSPTNIFWADDFDDPADLVRRSNYAPYFYARAVLTPDDVKEMLDADISRLRDAPLDRSGIVLAMRVRKGTVLALTETFCPLHPTLYPLVAELESIRLSKDPAVIGEMIEKLTVLRSAVS